jgi:hypothetical protein
MTYIEILQEDAERNAEIVRLRLAVDILRAELSAANKIIGSMFGGFSNE